MFNKLFILRHLNSIVYTQIGITSANDRVRTNTTNNVIDIYTI